MDFAEMLVCDVGINLCGCYGSVAEHSLNRTDIGAVSKKVGSIRMAQSVGAYVFAHNTGLSCIFFNYSLDASRGKSQISSRSLASGNTDK